MARCRTEQEGGPGRCGAGDEGKRATGDQYALEGSAVNGWHNGSVWELNPLGALFIPPTGFEDQGHHQVCKHSQAF